MNFLNCPNFNQSDECESSKKLVEKHDTCGENIGETFLIFKNFWFQLRSRPSFDESFFVNQEMMSKELERDRECNSILGKQEPRHCCSIPLIDISKMNSDCSEKCFKDLNDQTSYSTRVDSKHCCYGDCLLKIFFVDGGIQVDPVLSLYSTHISKTPDVDWKKVIEKSIEICNKQSEWTSFDFNNIRWASFFYLPKIVSESRLTNVSCRGLYELQEALECVKQTIFLNCPNFNNTAECKALKDFVEKNDKCGQKLGNSFILSKDFWTRHLRIPQISDFQTQKKDDSCLESFRHICCSVPQKFSNRYIKEEEKFLCRDFRSDDCCYYDFVQSEQKIVVDGKFHPEKFLGQYEKFISDMSSKFNWKPIVEKSIETCQKLSINY